MPGEEPTLSNRGFKHYEPIPSVYGGEIKVYESSAAMHPHIWVAITEPEDLNEAGLAKAQGVPFDGPMKNAHSHLRIEDAVRLRDQLTHLIENHYHYPKDPMS